MKLFLVLTSVLLSAQSFANTHAQKVECFNEQVKFSFETGEGFNGLPANLKLQVIGQKNELALSANEISVHYNDPMTATEQKYFVSGSTLMKRLFRDAKLDGDFSLTVVQAVDANTASGMVSLTQNSKKIDIHAAPVVCSVTKL